MHRHRAEHAVAVMCRLLGVSPSGSDAWSRRRPSDRELADGWLAGGIEGIWKRSRKTYGAPRIQVQLHRAHGIAVAASASPG